MLMRVRLFTAVFIAVAALTLSCGGDSDPTASPTTTPPPDGSAPGDSSRGGDSGPTAGPTETLPSDGSAPEDNPRRGDEKLTLEQFFEQARAIDHDFKERFDRLYEDFESPTEGNEDDLLAYKTSYREFSALVAEFFDEMETLKSPSEAADAFDEFLTTGRELVEFLRDFSHSVEGAESLAELERLFDEVKAESQAADERYRAACVALRELADANDVTGALDCGISGI
jgi:hypothetical protein